MISLKCPHCGHQMNIDDKYAGQAGKCANCKGDIIVPVQADRFEDFGVDRPETATPKPAPKAKEQYKPIIKKEDRGPRELPLGTLAVLGVVILIGAGVVVGTTIYSQMTDTVHREDPAKDAAAKALQNAPVPLSGKSLDDVLAFIPQRYKAVKWMETTKDEVYIGWDFNQGGDKIAKNCGSQAANFASDSLDNKATAYIVDAGEGKQGWRPGQPGGRFKILAIQGETQETKPL